MDMMELLVTMVNGESCSVSLSANATLGELKQRVASIFNVQASHQKLGTFVMLNDDSRRLRDYGLSPGSTVQLKVQPSMFQIFVKNEKGQTKTYDVTEDETVDELLRKVQQKERSPVQQQLLIYNGIQLEAGKKLRDYNIANGATIYMTLRLGGYTPTAMFQIFVKNEKDQTKTYNVMEDETVDELMRKVQHKERTPVQQQRLIYSGITLEAGKKLKDYNIVNGATIYMTLRLIG